MRSQRDCLRGDANNFLSVCSLLEACRSSALWYGAWILSYNEFCLNAYENVAKSDIKYHFILLSYNLYRFQIHKMKEDIELHEMQWITFIWHFNKQANIDKGRAQKLAIYALLQKCKFSLFTSLGIFV